MKFQVQLFSALMVVMYFAVNANAVEHTTDSLDTVKKSMAEKKAVLLDVRETAEWDNGHLKDAIHLSLSAIKKGQPPRISRRLLVKIRSSICIAPLVQDRCKRPNSWQKPGATCAL